MATYLNGGSRLPFMPMMSITKIPHAQLLTLPNTLVPLTEKVGLRFRPMFLSATIEPWIVTNYVGVVNGQRVSIGWIDPGGAFIADTLSNAVVNDAAAVPALSDLQAMFSGDMGGSQYQFVPRTWPSYAAYAIPVQGASNPAENSSLGLHMNGNTTSYTGGDPKNYWIVRTYYVMVPIV